LLKLHDYVQPGKKQHGPFSSYEKESRETCNGRDDGGGKFTMILRYARAVTPFQIV